ncbi:hypothetical protein GS907_24410 [Rhodococcus hoagii]|nr:hypothetical protein [Prescottella equi]
MIQLYPHGDTPKPISILCCIRLATSLCHMDTDAKVVAEAVKSAIMKSKYSYRDICEHTGITITTLNRRLNSPRPAKFEVWELIAIADLLNLSASTFLPERHRVAA